MAETLKKKICAIIPARGGSKGIPRKNLKELDGLSLIARSIIAAKNSNYINKIIVSSDDSEIINEAEIYGAETIRRNPNISGDNASSESAILDAIQKLKDNDDYLSDITVFLQCTSPFTTAKDIDGSIRVLEDNKADSSFTAIHFNHFLWRKSDSGSYEGINHDNTKIRQPRQKIEKQFLETGAIYVFKTSEFIIQKSRFFGKVIPYLIEPEKSIEIDEMHDLKLAEILIDNGLI